MRSISYLIYNDGAKVLIFSEITKGYSQISATKFQIRAEYCAIRGTKFSYGAFKFFCGATNLRLLIIQNGFMDSRIHFENKKIQN